MKGLNKIKKTIGIIGGMGPLATADMLKKIVESTVAKCDNDHIRVFVDLNPGIPDRTEAILHDGHDPVPEIAKAIESLEKCGADCLIMPCNSAHYYLDRLEALTSIPIISILDATADAGSKKHPRKTAALLGTKGLVQSGIYNAPLEKAGISFITPENYIQELLMECIYSVKAGEDIFTKKHVMQTIISKAFDMGADYFILGCTELPIIMNTLNLGVDYVDSTQELAEAAIRFCGYQTKSENRAKAKQ